MDIEKIYQKIKQEAEIATLPCNLNVSLAGQCHYKRLLELKSPKEFDTRSLGLFIIGHIIHSKVQEWVDAQKEVHLRGSFLTPEFHLPVENEKGMVSGKLDVLTDDEIIEVKTVHSNSFSYEPNEHYLFQLVSYREMWKIFSGKYLNISLLYVSRDDFRMAYIPISKSAYEPLSEEVIKDWIRIEEEYKLFEKFGTLPDPKPRWDWECKYCSFAPDCPLKPDLKEHKNKNFKGGK